VFGDVLALGDQLQVTRVAAGDPLAAVMDVEPGRDVADIELVAHVMGEHGAGAHEKRRPDRFVLALQSAQRPRRRSTA
jgi:hypothetical protein